MFDLIETRSFANVWFWIALAGLWTWRGAVVLGVPYELIQRAARDARALPDLTDAARLGILRRLALGEAQAVALVGAGAFALALLVGLALSYRFELAEALAILLAPLALTVWLDHRAARRIAAADPDPSELPRLLSRHRRTTLAVGVAAIFLTALWGTWRILSAGLTGFG
ncbi:MAG: component of SufBCD complex [Paracoccaceae bacterium]